MDYLKLLVYAIDFRSPYTVTHTADTTIISLETGKLLGLSKHELEALYIGAFLHDIGKIAVPHSVLEKPGRLTPEEFEIAKRHIPEGECILRGVISDEICDIALRHHEKLDGSGYAKGLTADALTLPQRIVAVADIMSALSQRRSYKEPFPKEKVVGILTEMKNGRAALPAGRRYRMRKLRHDPGKHGAEPRSCEDAVQQPRQGIRRTQRRDGLYARHAHFDMTRSGLAEGEMRLSCVKKQYFATTRDAARRACAAEEAE